MRKVLTPDIVVERLKNQGRFHLVLDVSSWQGGKKKALFTDTNLNKSWWVLPNDLLNKGVEHPDNKALKSSLSQKLSPAQVQEKINVIGHSFIRLIPGSYINTKSKAKFMDDTYGEFEALAGNVLAGSVHPCRSKQTRSELNVENTPESVNDKLSLQSRPHITMIERIPNSKKAVFEDSTFGRFECRPVYILRGSEHPTRARSNVDGLINKQFNRLTIVGFSHTHKGNTYLECLCSCGKPTIGQTNAIITNRKKSCGCILLSPETIQKRMETRAANGNTRSSREQEVYDFVESLGFADIDYAYAPPVPKQTRPGGYEIDVKPRSIKVGINYHGTYHHREHANITRVYHRDAAESCKRIGWKLIQVFCFEWRDRNEQVKSFIKSAMGKNELSIHARKCSVGKISKKEASEFIKQNHIQPNVRIVRAYGLKHNDVLVSVMTVSRHPRDNNILVMSRFCSLTNTSVKGAMGKLSKYMSKNEKQNIITWVDRRFGDSGSYEKSGWTVDKIYGPDYFYWDDRKKIKVSKQSRRKTVVNTPPVHD